MIDVLHIYAGNLFGGVERFLVTLATARSSCPEMRPSFALCFEGQLSEELRATGATVHVLGAVRRSRPWTGMAARRRLRQLLRTTNFDAVITHSPWPHVVFASAVRREKKPLVFWSHDAYPDPTALDRAAGRIRPDRIVANSHYTASTIPAIFPGVPIDVIYCPVLAPPARDRAAVRSEVRSRLGTSQQAVVILTAARMERWKGQSLLIRALAPLKARDGGAPWEAWIAGGPQRPHEEVYFAELQEQCRTLGVADRVRFLGQRKDIPDLLDAADIHCQPNLGAEPFGITFIEALYAGLPLVTTNLGAAPEIVRPDCGKLVPPDQPEALADALAELIRHPQERQRVATVGPARAAALCDPAGRLAALARLIESLSTRSGR